MKIIYGTVLFILIGIQSKYGQALHPVPTGEANKKIASLVLKFKTDPRGPYRDIRWFCHDGTFNEPKMPCPAGIGGVQRARYKEEVIALAQTDHIFLGQILSTTDKDEFWDAANYHSRLKQYQIEKWLRSVDNGWINRKAQYYRGATQAEDEESWGREFLGKILLNDDNIERNFYLLREATKDIPHRGDDNLAQLMRSQSKVISDLYAPFMNLRVKIHGQPEFSDIEKVRQFRAEHNQQLNNDLRQKFDELLRIMESYFKPLDVEMLLQLAKPLSVGPLKDQLITYIDNFDSLSTDKKLAGVAELIWSIREQMLEQHAAQGRLTLFDISLQLERLFLQESAKSNKETLHQLLFGIALTGKVAAACGYVEIWEWHHLEKILNTTHEEELTVDQLNQFMTAARNLLEWGTGMVKAVYEPTLNMFQGFEPLTHGFIDDRIRGSVALPLGNDIGVLGKYIAASTSLSNQVLSIPNQSHIRGLNPGYTQGELVVISGSADDMEVDPSSIYIFERPPADLKPIAGIATVSEGNLVSHVQLLARNLGIPNVAISQDNLSELKKFQGEKVFFAVSHRGNVIMKLAKEMSSQETALFTNKERSDEMITVPVDQINLATKRILNLTTVNASSSGKICGPKAANLGELKSIFPENVVDGLVIPFGIFLDHMQQTIPGDSISYWQFLTRIFYQARSMQNSGKDQASIESFQLKELETLRSLIKQIPLLPSFRTELNEQFEKAFGKPLGEVPVFLRSDTNMEDLKDFSGAGLNLTLFNVLDQNQILDGIKNVWASPYTERSFKWRQKYLLNPENVYPSILIIPSVKNDYSGVVITKGIISGKPEETTIAFSRGVGGAVEGQASETWVLGRRKNAQLLSPSREPVYTSLPLSGGIQKNYTTFHQPIVNENDFNTITGLRGQLIRHLQAKGIDGPFDIELGFKDSKLWLFQVRPFVENKKAISSKYLESITPKIDGNKKLRTSERINNL